MPRLLIAGCGYLGQAVAELFLAANWEVEGWTISSESAGRLSMKPYSVRSVDISKQKDIAAKAGKFDAVIHSASTRGGDADAYRHVYLDGARNLLQRFGGSRILFVSSTSVYAQKAGESVTETSLAEPRHETGKILREAENLVLGSGGIVSRLAGIYGPGRSSLLRKFLSGRAVVDPQNDPFVNQIHRDDAAAAIRLLSEGGATGEIYNVVDDAPILQSECYRWLAAKLNRPIPSVGRSAFKARKRGESNKRVSNAKLRAVGWRPRYPRFADGMEKSVLSSFNLETI